MSEDKKSPKTILVVEDERPLLVAIKKMLEKRGYTVVTAQSVENALDDLKNFPEINAIWLDHYLLGSDSGLDLVGKLKSDDSDWKRIPVFVVSNTASPEKVQAYLELGVDNYFAKVDNKLNEIIDQIDKSLLGSE